MNIKDTVGIDTAHSYNETQTMTQKYKDGISQITQCIESYQIVMEARKTDLKYQVKKRVGK